MHASRSTLEKLALSGLVILIVGIYIWLASAGHWRAWPPFGWNTQELAYSFLNGHTYMLRSPSAALLAKANPFDPANVKLWRWDFCLYKSHFYSYWGPVPAFGLAIVNIFVGGPFSDAQLVFGFACLRLVCVTILLYLIYRRCFFYSPFLLLIANVLVAAFMTPIPSILTRGAVYEVAIIAAQAFIALGSVLALLAVTSSQRSRGLQYFSLAGLAWALAIGSRASHLFGVALAVCVTLAVCWRQAQKDSGDSRTKVFQAALALGLPLLLGGAALAAYNYARFDSIFEFGLRYQLAVYHASFGIRYVLYNICSYLFRPLEVLPHFPFIVAPWLRGLMQFPFIKTPAYFYPGEPLPGLVYVYPYGIFALLAIYISVRKLRIQVRKAEPVVESGDDLWLWVLGAAIAFSLVSFLPCLYLFAAIMRYLGDISVGLVLLSALGSWLSYSYFASRKVARSLVLPLVILTGLATSLIGILLGIHSQNLFFRTFNPELYQRLEIFLSF